MNKELIKKTITPKASILCITYNQEKYIRQTVDSFLMQKTDFDYEILINDDASNDGTVDILKEYKNKYPNKIKLNLQSENQYSKGVRNMITRFLLPKAKGEYLALCEGDDFWTDPNKLQLQVDFLENHPNYSVCFHQVRVFFENHEKPDSIYPESNNQDDFTLEALLRTNFIQTNSVMYRKQHYKGIATDVIPGDWYMHLYHAQFGKIGFIDKVMSAYRKHSGGIWWGALGDDQKEFWKKNGLLHLRLYKELLGLFGKNPVYQTIILKNAGKNTSSIIESDDSKDKHLFLSIVADSPEFIRQAVLNNLEEIKDKNKQIKDKEYIIYTQSKEIESVLRDITKLEEDKANLLNSRNYRIGKLVLYPFRVGKIFYRKVVHNIYGLLGKKR